ncbi:MAG: hypothetical protein EBZ94_08225, partial [Crocinitomicaceae bacterium]|nr:hypothetical protein [Crocinitomicaceae bacterium]
LACYQTATFNTTSCAWDVTGTQAAQPTLACYQTATFNNTTCVWDVTGTQAAQPTLACYQTATFNNTTCVWDVTGTQATQPTLACYQTASFNNTTCVWDVSGTQATNTTTISASGSYTWANNGQTYSSSGTYSGNVVNCIAQVLNLTITPLLTPHYTIWLANTSSTSNTMDFDVMFSVDAPTNGVKLSGLSVGINYNSSIVNGGALSIAYMGGKTPAINSLVNSVSSATAGHLRILSTPLVIGSAIDIPVGTYRLGTYRVTNSLAWTSASNAQLWLNPTNTGGKTISAVNSWPFGATSGTSASYTVANLGVTLNYTSTSTLSVLLNAASGPTASVLSGSATICA